MAQEAKKKKNRLRYMILSVIIAVIAWAVVTYTTDPDITKSFAGIRVELTGEDELAENGYVIVNRDDIPKLTVKMRGKRSDLIKALDKTRIVVDVSGISESGEIEVEGAVKLPNSRITVEKVSSQTVPVTVEKLVSKDVPVRVVQTGEIEGKLVKSAPESETVKIRGAKAELDMVEALEVTVDVVTLSQSGTTEHGYSLVLKEDADAEELSTLVIEETLMKVTNTIYEMQEVPVKVLVKEQKEFTLKEDETEAEPKTVKIGVTEGSQVEYVTVTIDENAPAGEYKTDKPEGVYIPEHSRTVTIKPVWEKIN